MTVWSQYLGNDAHEGMRLKAYKIVPSEPDLSIFAVCLSTTANRN
jgi:hypothetical protein